MAKPEEPIVQRVTLDVSEAMQAIQSIRAAYATFRAEVDSAAPTGAAPAPVGGGGAAAGPHDVNAGSRQAPSSAAGVPIAPPAGRPPAGGESSFVRTATDGSQVIYDPTRGTWERYDPNAPPAPDAGALRDAMRQVNAANRADYQRSRATHAAVSQSVADAAWMGEALAETRGMPVARFGLSAGAALAPAVGMAADEAIGRELGHLRTGRKRVLQDYPLGIAMASAAAGALVGGLPGAVVGFGVGLFGGKRLQEYAYGINQSESARLVMDYYGGSGSARDLLKGYGASITEQGGANFMDMAAGLNRALVASGYGPQSKGLAAHLAKQAAERFATSGAVPDPVLRDLVLKDLPKGIDAFTAPEIGGPYDAGTAAALMEKDFDSGVAYMRSLGGGDPSIIAARLATAQRANVRAQAEATAVGAQTARVAEVTARGGTAADITGAMGQESAALSRAAQATQDYIRSLEAVGVKTEEQKLRLEQANVALAQTNAAIAQLANQAATVRVAERMDIASTRGAVANTALGIALAGATTANAGMFTGSIEAVESSIAAARTGLRERDLRPEQRRELERSIAADEMRLFDLRRARYDWGSQFTQNRAATAASLSQAMGETLLIGAATAGNASDVLFRQARASQGLSDAAYDRLASMRRSPGFYTADAMDAQKVDAVRAGNAARDLRIAGAAPGLAPGQMSFLTTQDVGAAWAMRNLGSAGAQGYLTSSMGALGSYIESLPAALSRGLRSAASPDEARGMVFASQQQTAQAQAQWLALQAARGSYQPAPALGMEADAARFNVAMADLGPFYATNPVGAYRDQLSVNRRMLSEMQRELDDPTLDPAARRTRTQQMQALQLENASIAQRLNYGWEGRLMQMSSNMPGFAAQYAGSFRDALLGGVENPVVGAISEAGAERNRVGDAGGSDRNWRIGDAFTQGVTERTVNHTVTIRLEDGQGRYLGSLDFDAAARRAGSSEVMTVLMDGRR